ncbi:hypothetical protein ACN27F_34235 [Solwaraspora sp. WMMB335]|uniref:hypothetical protein n=1 Tax=Solwaraspora sp. WMMB335 TaxID=3404118 RepID=UPI003B9581B0
MPEQEPPEFDELVRARRSDPTDTADRQGAIPGADDGDTAGCSRPDACHQHQSCSGVTTEEFPAAAAWASRLAR